MANTTVRIAETWNGDSSCMSFLKSYQTDVQVITWASADTISLDTQCSYIEVTCPIWNTWPVYIKAGLNGTVTVSDFDAVVLPGQTISKAIWNQLETQITVIGTASDTAYIIQY